MCCAGARVRIFLDRQIQTGDRYRPRQSEGVGVLSGDGCAGGFAHVMYSNAVSFINFLRCRWLVASSDPLVGPDIMDLFIRVISYIWGQGAVFSSAIS